MGLSDKIDADELIGPHSSIANMFVVYSCLLLLLSAELVLTQSDTDCTILQASDLGSFSVYTGDGLVALTLNSHAHQGANNQYRLEGYNIVCLAQGSGLNFYRMISVIVSYALSGVDGTATTQFNYLCQGRQWVNFGTIRFLLVGNLSTPVRRDCSICGNTAGRIFSDAEHCVGKSMVKSDLNLLTFDYHIN